MRDSESVITWPVTHVINLSIIQGVVPRVVPLFKKNDKIEVSNYRPVSIICNISKVFERVVYEQVDAYLDQKRFCTNFSLVLEVAFPLIHV